MKLPQEGIVLTFDGISRRQVRHERSSDLEDTRS